MKATKQILPLFILIAIDALGTGIVAPVLAPLIKSSTHGIYSSTHSIEIRYLIYGIIIALDPICFFFGAPLLGHFSDRVGRKKILLFCLAGSTLGFMSYSVAFYINSLLLLVLARCLSGFAAGSQAIAQAAIADISSGEQKAINIGVIAFAMTLGLVLGPLLAGIFSNSHYVSFFNNTTPFLLAGLLSISNLIYLCISFKETYKIQTAHFNLSWSDFKQQFTALLQSRWLMTLLVTFFFFECAWSLYFQSLALILVKYFDFSSSQIGYFSAYVGLSLSFGLIYLVRICAKRFDLSKMITVSLTIGASAFILLCCMNTLVMQLLMALPITFSVAIIYTFIITLLSNHVAADQQGFIMGISDALLALAFALSGIFSGLLTYQSGNIALLVSASLYGLCLIVFIALQNKTKSTVNNAIMS